jgi:secreted PhoX family phosphatase
MACFAMPNGRLRLVRNHELRGDPATGRAHGDPLRAYDPKGIGGTSTIELRLRSDGSPEILRTFMSLTGTLVNCAGGPTPWGSWLTCEETTVGTREGWTQDHGYVFEVPASADHLVLAVPLKAMGRFVHEAVALDPRTGIVYLTEDQGTAGFYRFIPTRPGLLGAGGRLEMLAIDGQPRYDTRSGQRTGMTYPARWVEIDDPDPSDGLPGAVYQQGLAKGAATFARLEGAWWGDESVYFHATSGGDRKLGQVWRYRPNVGANGEVLLVFESPSPEVLNAPDNITCSPRGGVVLCEDAAGTCHLRGLTREGEVFPFAQNILNEREFAGACYSPDGRVLFVNIQGVGRLNTDPKLLGMTFAIWGPWERGAL